MNALERAGEFLSQEVNLQKIGKGIGLTLIAGTIALNSISPALAQGYDSQVNNFHQDFTPAAMQADNLASQEHMKDFPSGIGDLSSITSAFKKNKNTQATAEVNQQTEEKVTLYNNYEVYQAYETEASDMDSIHNERYNAEYLKVEEKFGEGTEMTEMMQDKLADYASIIGQNEQNLIADKYNIKDGHLVVEYPEPSENTTVKSDATWNDWGMDMALTSAKMKNGTDFSKDISNWKANRGYEKVDGFDWEGFDSEQPQAKAPSMKKGF